MTITELEQAFDGKVIWKEIRRRLYFQENNFEIGYVGFETLETFFKVLKGGVKKNFNIMFFGLEKEVNPVYRNHGRIKWKDSHHKNFLFAIRDSGCFKKDDTNTMNFSKIDKISWTIFK